jgi:hypothetical protein
VSTLAGTHIYVHLYKTANSGKEPTVKIPVDENTEDPANLMTKNSIKVYVNDSFNIDSIPFEVDEILEEITK